MAPELPLAFLAFELLFGDVINERLKLFCSLPFSPMNGGNELHLRNTGVPSLARFNDTRNVSPLLMVSWPYLLKGFFGHVRMMGGINVVGLLALALGYLDTSMNFSFDRRCHP